jgi:hypothetical protein
MCRSFAVPYLRSRVLAFGCNMIFPKSDFLSDVQTDEPLHQVSYLACEIIISKTQASSAQYAPHGGIRQICTSYLAPKRKFPALSLSHRIGEPPRKFSVMTAPSIGAPVLESRTVPRYCGEMRAIPGSKHPLKILTRKNSSMSFRSFLPLAPRFMVYPFTPTLCLNSAPAKPIIITTTSRRRWPEATSLALTVSRTQCRGGSTRAVFPGSLKPPSQPGCKALPA